MTLAPRLLVIALSALLAGCAGGADAPAPHGHAPAAAGSMSTPPPLLTDLGTYSHKITTASPQAQQYFDQGLRLTYGFNHLEAQRAFREAARLDPACAMCYWGIALTYGSNYNDPDQSRAREGRAGRARRWRSRQAPGDAGGARHHRRPRPPASAGRRARRARPRLRGRHARGRAPVPRRSRGRHALRGRHDGPPALEPVDAGWPAPARDARDRRHARARARGAIPTIPARSTSTSTRWKPSPIPPRRRPRPTGCAALLPGAGHLVHMPSHIYFRIGRYADAAAVNVDAAASDRAYFSGADPRHLPDDVLPSQPRLHLARRQHGGARRGDSAGRARLRGSGARPS